MRWLISVLQHCYKAPSLDTVMCHTAEGSAVLFSHLGGRREGKGESSQHIDFREPQKAKEIENKNNEKEV